VRDFYFGLVVVIVRASFDSFEREARNGSPAIFQLAVMLFFHAHRTATWDRARTGRRRG
jgi:hypothetical protein